jgi:heme-degrading monooxygenase HmoA
MIARVWRGYAAREHADAYAAMLKPELRSGLSKVRGYRGSYLLRRDRGDEVEFVTIILWDSLDAIKASAGEHYERAVVPEERRKHLRRWDDVAAHYEVDGSHGVSFVS